MFQFTVFALALVAGLALLMGSQDAKSNVTAADRYVLRDAGGKERLRIGMESDGPVLSFLDDAGTELASLGVNKQGVLVRYVSNRGQLMSGLSIERTGVALVTIDETGRLQSGPNALKPDAGLLGPRRP
jgi:hypothetical protein